MSITYDEHPTNPVHGGKMSVEQMIERISILEDALVKIIELSDQRTQRPTVMQMKYIAECALDIYGAQ